MKDADYAIQLLGGRIGEQVSVNDDDALLSARELLGCVLYGLEEDEEEIPTPTPLSKIKTESMSLSGCFMVVRPFLVGCLY